METMETLETTSTDRAEIYLAAQTMLLALGVGMYAIDAGFAADGGAVVVLGFPIGAFAYGALRLFLRWTGLDIESFD
ncbi:hypothetical protein SAMN04487950_1482 [Halogranum rubrum]|uniref:Uncharacterized protein n=1 Tax=Halogranum rubrum TaxID=553466 RepID=A0A1I4CYU5_9EURY|nr:hypothetical protein [Halogranum rubrum]SFK85953.1 hypothetical protein SAMN04487950_1482 [Halogranum rubrum]